MTAPSSSFPPRLKTYRGEKKEKSQPERIGVMVSGLVIKRDGGDESDSVMEEGYKRGGQERRRGRIEGDRDDKGWP